MCRPRAFAKKGGRKCCLESTPELEGNFQQVLRDYTAGDPMDGNVRWTNLTQLQIADALDLAGTPVSREVVRQLLHVHGYVRRQAQKKQAMGTCPQRDEQFQNIARLRQKYLTAGKPVLSIDTKKKELLGNFHRAGTLYAREVIETWDHDFPSAAVGKAIPHGIYDVGRNLGHITLGTSHDTCQFAGDSLELYWRREGSRVHPNATEILIFCDTAGSNGTGPMFKQALQRFANRTGLKVRVAHYPPYASKYNPIEHRLFPHITRACRGVVLHSLKLFRDLIRGTYTTKGLEVTVAMLRKLYQTGCKVPKAIQKTFCIEYDEHLPKWNYRVLPQPT